MHLNNLQERYRQKLDFEMMIRFTSLSLVVLLAGLASTQAAPILARSDSSPTQAGPTSSTLPSPLAPSPTGWPPGPSMKTITHTSTPASPIAEGTAGATAQIEGQALAVGPKGAFYSTHAMSGLSKDGGNATSAMDEDEDCEDEMPLDKPHSPASSIAQGMMAAPPVPKAGTNETIPLTPSPVQPDGPASAASSQPSGMDNFMNADKGGMTGLGRRTLFMRDRRRSRQS